jgi:hypothetical protein
MPDQQIHQVMDAGYSVTLDQMNIPRPRLTAYSKPINLSALPRDGAIYGGVVKKVTGKKAGLPVDSLPGAKAIPFGESKKIDFRTHNTGLYLVGIDFVPRELAAILESRSLTLNKDGSLVDRNSDPVVALVTSEMYHVQVKTPKVQVKTSKVSPPELRPEAEPFPFTCYSFNPWAVYHSGFHVWYETGTTAVAYGPDASGGCSNASPHTKIDYIQAIAAVNWPGDFEQGWNTDQISAYNTWDVGYFWPAHGVPVTTNSAIWADGTFSMSRTENLSW